MESHSKKKRVGLMTTFFEAESGYSLVGVTETKIRMLLDHGYDPVVLVQENFESPPSPTLWSDTMIDLRRVVPRLDLHEGVAPDFEDRVADIHAPLSKNLHDVDVCITEDIMLQSYFKEHNVAVRLYAKTRPDLLWLHWLHSCPSPSPSSKYPDNCRHTPPPGYLVYPNSYDIGRVANAYNLAEQQWRVKVCRAGHAIAPLNIGQYDDLTRSLVTKAGLLNGDVVAIYPVRLDRGKQPEKIVSLMAGIADAGYEPRLLVVDWQSAGERFQNYIDELLDMARELGIEGKINFTSRLDDRCSQGIPRHVVTELMDLSNVYIHPSATETYSLVVHEAALRGLLLCLNYDFPVMHELFGDVAIYFDFSSDRFSRDYQPDEATFWKGEARRLLAELRQNRGLMAKTTARKEWNPEVLWPNLEALLYLQPVGE